MNLYLAAAPIGLATGILAWFAAGGASANTERLAPLEQQIAGVKLAQRPASQDGYVSIADLAAAPIFAMTVGPGAVVDPLIRLDGVALTHQRVAALISIDGAPSEWVKAGETRGGVTLQQVRSTKIVVDTPLGTKEVALGERSGTSSAASGATSPAQAPVTSSDQTPPGFRSPPPPASAPRAP